MRTSSACKIAFKYGPETHMMLVCKHHVAYIPRDLI